MMHTFLRRLCVVALCLGYIKASADFDCRRTSQSCVTGTCNDVNGDCDCPTDANGVATHRNADCGLEIAKVVPTALCGPPCLNGGECYEPTVGTYMCMCPEAFYGNKCENPRKKVECSGTEITINYMPIPTFSGDIFILDNRNTPECAFTEANGMYTATFTYQQCGVTTTNDQPNAGDTSYEISAAVRFNANIERATDMKLTAKCVIDGTGQSNLNDNIGTVSVDQRTDLTEETALTEYQPVSFQLQGKNGNPMPVPVNLGDELRIYIPLADTGRYTKLKITELQTNNGMVEQDLVMETLIFNGCLTDIGEALVTGDISSDPAIPAIIINFMAFRLRGSPQVKFDARVQVCEGTDTSCDSVVCPSPPQSVPSNPQNIPPANPQNIPPANPQNIPPANPQISPSSSQRKRRAAPDNEVILHETLTVLDPRSNEKLRLPHNKSDIKSQQNADPQQCLQSTEIMVMVIVLIVAVVLLLVITTCLAVKFMKQRAAQVKIYNPDMPTGNNTVRIPRAAC
uniref:EGF-like domain-containing protein 1 n=1 Tax=Lottia gigantea TaxID=225164 RepID=ELDP1_LOTGI|nr:RecName: Full=EGF-like domain-containing protein 1; AltName: Full=Uncharacterized shell protein 17; Short=LUSP-17; Flags: Precursor [Lottia gigantea]